MRADTPKNVSPRLRSSSTRASSDNAGDLDLGGTRLRPVAVQNIWNGCEVKLLLSLVLGTPTHIFSGLLTSCNFFLDLHEGPRCCAPAFAS
eukprot:1159106-Pelagomonas_calceolata.AAC.1